MRIAEWKVKILKSEILNPNSAFRNPNSEIGLRMFHDDARNDVGGLIPTVGRIAEMPIDLSHLQHVNRISPFEEISQC